jgi:hypothetical protein
LKGKAPLQFEIATDLTPWADTFDVAFGYEVIHLLPESLDDEELAFWSSQRAKGEPERGVSWSCRLRQ